jgi:DNA repair protein RadA/Sms
MSKTKTTFFCQNCGSQSPKWVGKCPNCGEWNTFVEEVVQKENKNSKLQLFSSVKSGAKESNKPVLLHDIGSAEYPRIAVPGKELTRVLGGGIVPGSMVLFGGEPGIGKSTLMLQLALRLKNLKVVKRVNSKLKCAQIASVLQLIPVSFCRKPALNKSSIRLVKYSHS